MRPSLGKQWRRLNDRFGEMWPSAVGRQEAFAFPGNGRSRLLPRAKKQSCGCTADHAIEIILLDRYSRFLLCNWPISIRVGSRPARRLPATTSCINQTANHRSPCSTMKQFALRQQQSKLVGAPRRMAHRVFIYAAYSPPCRSRSAFRRSTRSCWLP
jgi:hypothetical protein